MKKKQNIKNNNTNNNTYSVYINKHSNLDYNISADEIYDYLKESYDLLEDFLNNTKTK